MVLSRRIPRVPGRLERRLILGIRLACLVLGIVMLFGVIEDILATRARYVSSSPSAGAMVDRVPDDVTIRFSHTLDPVSSISVYLVASPSPSGEFCTSIYKSSRRPESIRATSRLDCCGPL